ncbi:MAG: hypothetical protein OXN89_21955 [Bryobacterales bacterium]|nr:hypothetical protein [Bryobacterales bacterium]
MIKIKFDPGPESSDSPYEALRPRPGSVVPIFGASSRLNTVRKAAPLEL